MKTYIISEAAGTWLHGGLDAAEASIRAAASAGIHAWKTQWTSDYAAMHKRRGIKGDSYKRLQWDIKYHERLKVVCDDEGIDYICTVFLPQDVATIAPYVARFKISAFEESDKEIHYEMQEFRKPVIVSHSGGAKKGFDLSGLVGCPVYRLHCVSQYPTPNDQIRLIALTSTWDVRGVKVDDLCSCTDMAPMANRVYDGLSDHTTSVLTGAVAVGAGATIIEVHFRLDDTPKSDPDYLHSRDTYQLKEYIANIRIAERMMYG